MASEKIAVIRDGFADSPYGDDELSADNRSINNLVSGDFSSSDAVELSKAATVGAVKEFLSSSGGTGVLNKTEYHVIPSSPNYIELANFVYSPENVVVFTIEGTLQLNQRVVSTISTPPNFTIVDIFPNRVYIRDDIDAGVSGLSSLEVGVEIAIFYTYSV